MEQAYMTFVDDDDNVVDVVFVDFDVDDDNDDLH